MATNIGVLPASASAAACASSAVDIHALVRHQLAVADQHAVPVDRRPDAVAGDRLEAASRPPSSMPRSRAPATIASASGCSEPRLGGRHQPQQVVLAPAIAGDSTSVRAGLPSVSVPVLSRTTA